MMASARSKYVIDVSSKIGADVIDDVMLGAAHATNKYYECPVDQELKKAAA